MKKKIQLFLYNLKNSWLFLTVIFVELVICMSLLAVALTNFLGVNSKFSYYNAKVADKSFVAFENFSSEVYSTVENVSKWLNDDLKSLATSVNIGEVQVDNDWEKGTPRLTIVTPALCANFNNKGLKFAFNSDSDYREAYVAKRFEDDYKLNRIYDVAVDCDDDIYSKKIKVIGYFDYKEYYAFGSDSIYYASVDMVVCDELPPFATLSSGIFVNDKQPSHYKDLGFKSLTVKEYYEYSREGSPYEVYLYFALIVILFTFVTILCNYILSVDNMSKRNAVLYACGNTNAMSILIEGVKMLFAFLAAFVVSICVAEITIYISMQRQNIVMTRGNFYLSALIVLGLYIAAIVIGFVKFVKAKPLKVINLEKK